MSEKKIFAEISEDLCKILEHLCNELDGLNERLGIAEEELVLLADRVNASELHAGIVATSKLADVSFEKVEQIEEVKS